MAALTDDGSAVIARGIDDGLVQIHGRRGARKEGMTESEVSAAYDIDGTAAAIQQHGAQRVALQMPDWLLCDATLVQTALRAKCDGVLLFVMADTLFAPCCVDEITAQHCGADMIVKYGHSCLTATARGKVHYVHPPAPDTLAPTAAFSQTLAAFLADKPTRDTLLVAEPSLRSTVQGTEGATLLLDPSCPAAPATPSDSTSPFVVGGCAIPESTHHLAVVTENEGVLTQAYLWAEYQRAAGTGRELLVLGGDGSARDTAHCPVYRGVVKRLRQRHFTMEKVKDAEVVAIVVVSLAIAGYAQAVDHMQRILAEAGKQSIVVYVGKPNVPKLANYEEVDIYCVIACSQSTWFDAKEYPKPVVTPIEVASALSEADNDTECNPLLTPQYYSLELAPVMRHYLKALEAEPTLSLVSGVLRGATVPAVPEDDCEEEGEEVGGGQLTAYAKRELAMFEASPIVQRMHARAYQGLEARKGETEVQETIPDGLHGIASGYSSEPVVGKATPAFLQTSSSHQDPSVQQ